mgnify:FL=1
MSKDTTISLAALGLDRDAVLDALVDRLVDGAYRDEDGSGLLDEVRKTVAAAVTANVNRIAAEVVEPKVADIIEKLTFTKTNGWGEPKSAPMTYREYLLKVAEDWCNEPVSYEGKVKGQDGYSWSAKSSRLAYMVDRHLHHEIETSVKTALADANSQLSGGIVAAVKTVLGNVLAGIKVSTSVK